MGERAAQIAKGPTDTDEDKVPDMLDLLVKANTAEREDQRLSDEEVRSQLSTLVRVTCPSVLADTSCLQGAQRRQARSAASSVSWHSTRTFRRACARKSRRPRNGPACKLNATDVADGSETLSALPLLDAAVRETLRLEPPATCTVRISTQDTVIPLSVPVRGRDGTMIEKALPVAKGSYVLLCEFRLGRANKPSRPSNATPMCGDPTPRSSTPTASRTRASPR